jgi:hypothetical protein
MSREDRSFTRTLANPARTIFWVGLLVAVFLPGRSTEARAAVNAEVGVNLSLFHDRLAVHGDWISLAHHGWVWTPRHVAHGWRPYLAGHWVFTDADWTWISEEPWGWATYHYGRWLFERPYGWMWVPATVWGPAWVDWRWGGGYVGWAPLPPEVEVSIGNIDVDLDPFAFCFVEERFFLDPLVARRVLPVARNVTLLRVTSDITRYSVENGQSAIRGVGVHEVERASGHAVTRLRLRDVTTVEAHGQIDPRSNELAVYRPAVRPPSRPRPAAISPETPRTRSRCR